MSGLTLTLRDVPAFGIDLSSLLPSTLEGKRTAQIKAIKLASGRRRVALGDLFEINGDGSGEALTIRNSTPALHRIGANLERGTITVLGHCGLEAGLRMRGGLLSIEGDAGDGLGLGMRGGVIDVKGSAGDGAGGPAPGDVTGMKDGTILVGKHLGARAGERMRRGLIAVAGNVGTRCGSQMIAGSIVVLGQCAGEPGTGMRRGTILLANPPPESVRGFVLAGCFELAFLPVLTRYLAELKPAWRGRLARLSGVERWVGDAANGSLGEILIAT